MRGISIHFSVGDSDTLVHRIRNFGEELFRQIELKGIGNLTNVDSAIDHIGVKVHAARHLGTVNGIIKKELQRHNLTQDATVRRE